MFFLGKTTNRERERERMTSTTLITASPLISRYSDLSQKKGSDDVTKEAPNPGTSSQLIGRAQGEVHESGLWKEAGREKPHHKSTRRTFKVLRERERETQCENQTRKPPTT